MLLNFKFGVACVLALSLTACGGGSSDSDSSNNNPIPPSGNIDPDSKIIINASDYTPSQLKTAAKSLVTKKYTGSKQPAQLDISLSQFTFKQVFNAEGLLLPNLYLEKISSNTSDKGDINAKVACDVSGSINYKGKLNSDGLGNVSIEFDRCKSQDNSFTTGNFAIAIKSVLDNDFNLDIYFDNVTWNQGSSPVSVTGFYGIKESIDNAGGYKNSFDVELVYNVAGQQYLYQLVRTAQNSAQIVSESLQGDYFVSDIGKVAIKTELVGANFFGGKIIFSGSNQTALEFNHDVGSVLIKYTQDNDNDGVHDAGTYFYDLYDLISGDVSKKLLVSLDTLSLPPVASSPWGNTYNVYTYTPLMVTAGSYSDPDTPIEQLQISYRWYINGVLVEGQNSNILPANIAVYGDDVKVSMVVFDGSNYVESSFFTFTLADAPLEIELTNLPRNIHAGDTIEFTASFIDPDNLNSPLSSKLLAAPSGATINSDGLVTWSVGNDFLFPLQTFDFTFAIMDANGNITHQQVVSIEATSDKPFPVTRSGIEVPSNNQSMLIGDFDRDGRNEVLATDNLHRLFLLTESNGNYSQKWLYPFNLPTRGNIVQLLTFDLDNDRVDEILVVTQHGISVIDGLNSLARSLFDTEHYISSAAITDTNSDGIAEIGYLHAKSDNYSDTSLSVISYKAPNTSLFSFDVEQAKQVIFADVDNQAGLEIILNNGLVYDATTGANKWISSTQFGDAYIAAGDVNNDGVNEIVGANSWGSIKVFSAQNKSQLASLEVFNTCSINVSNIDNDAADEIIIGDCQWGYIHSYNLVGADLVQLWSVNMQDHGSKSVVIGDSDNDGKDEIHWSTGTSSSGEDSFIVADLTASTVTIKPNVSSVQLDKFSSAGWSHITEDNEQAVFFVPESSSGYGGSRIVTMNTQGQYDISDEISSNWDRSSIAVTTDYNQDGFGDIFLPTTNLYDGSFGVMQLFDHSMQWQTTGNSNADINTIKAEDINADGFIDAIYSDSNKLNVVDIENEKIIAKYAFGSNIDDVEINLDNIIVARYQALSVLTLGNGQLSEKSFIDQSCNRIQLINYDTDAAKELLCIKSDRYLTDKSDIYIYDIIDNTLIEKAHYEYKNRIIDVAIDPSTSNQQAFYLTTQQGTDSIWDDDNIYLLEKLNASGHTIWRSPRLIGQPSEHSLKVRLNPEGETQIMLATSRAMYLIN